MEDPGPKVLHRFQDYVLGVNWRPMRVAEAVPKERVCSFCNLIPKTTLPLPCGHFLCMLCYSSSLRNGSGVCPLDRKSFHPEYGSSEPVSDWRAETVKAHCWNEANGCEFVGTIKDVLLHYENHCNWHEFECPRCKHRVVRKHAHEHIWNECTIIHSDGARRRTPVQGSVVGVGEVSAAVDELKQLIREPLHDQLPVLQSKINELVEQSRKHTAQLGEITQGLRDSRRDAKHEVSQMAETLSSALRHENNLLVEHSKSSTHRLLEVTGELKACERSLNDELKNITKEIPSTIMQALESWLSLTAEKHGGNFRAEPMETPMSWRMEMMLILRKLERLGDVSLGALECLRQNAHPSDRDPVIAFCEPLIRDWSGLRRKVDTLSPPPWERFKRRPHSYLVTLENSDEIFSSPEPREWNFVAEVNQWHGQDAYFTLLVAIMKDSGCAYLGVWIKFFGVLETCHSRVKGVCILHKDKEKDCQMVKSQFFIPDRFCDETFCGYEAQLSLLRDEGFHHDGKMMLSVFLTDEQADVRDFLLASSLNKLPLPHM